MSSLARRLDPWPTLRGAPIALPQLLALLALVTLSAAEGGFPLEHWAPAAVLICLLLAVAFVALPAGRRRSPESRITVVAITAFAVWTALSLLWSDDLGAAAIASTRTGLLAATFVLFARWRHAPRTATTVVTVLTAGLGILAWGVLLELRATDTIDPWFLYDRLLEPVGYVNAGAAFWGVTAFLGVGLLGGGGLPGAQRVVGALVVVPAAALSLLCLSRGGLLSSGIVVVLLLLLLPGRARNGAALGIAGLGVLVAVPALLDVGEAVRFSTDPTGILHTAVVRVMAGAFVTLAATVAWIRIERSVPVTDPLRPRAARVGGALVAGLGVVAVVCVLAGVGPITVDTVRDGARTITKSYDEQTSTAESRLSAGLNSGRWDFWTVAWDQFAEEPLVGKGADNYRQDYLLQGKSPENPRYPHSLWLRTLGQLGLVGTLLMLVWVLGVAVAIRRLAAAVDPAGRALAMAAGGAFGLWVVHGSVDWLMEFGGLSAIVAAVGGLAVAALPVGVLAAGGRRPQPGAEGVDQPTGELSALDRLVAAEAERASVSDAPAADTPAGTAPAADPQAAQPDADRGGSTAPARRRGRAVALPFAVPALGIVVAVPLLLICALWSATQWVADRDRAAAAVLALDQPRKAVERAERARSLEPFGEQADMLLGALAVRRGDLDEARASYERAYDDNPRAARPRLWLGVLASAAGDRREARRWMRRAARAAPRDPIAAALEQQVRDRVTLDPAEVQRQLADRTAQLVRDPDPVDPAATPLPGAATPPATTPLPGAPTPPPTTPVPGAETAPAPG